MKLNLLFLVLISLKQYNHIHENESMKQPNKSELSILTFLLLYIQKRKCWRIWYHNSELEPTLWSHKFKKLKPSTMSRKEAYIDEKKSLEEWSVGDICPTENVFTKWCCWNWSSFNCRQLKSINDHKISGIFPLLICKYLFEKDIRIIKLYWGSQRSDFNTSSLICREMQQLPKNTTCFNHLHKQLICTLTYWRSQIRWENL